VLQVPPGGKIQAVLDAAQPGDLILVPPGSYLELVIMWKPVRLQGWGPGSTHIVAVKAPAEKIVDWRAKVMALIENGSVSLIPNQENGAPLPAEPLEPLTLFNEEGPGILVLARNAPVAQGGFGFDARRQPNARIDGLSISGGDNAGGIMVNGYAHGLVISNTRVQSNAGTYGGGVRVGMPYLVNAANTGYQSAFNDNLWVHHNNINRNGGIEGAGGGISLYTGSDQYRIEDNFICGNFSGGHGGGIGHLGVSNNGSIARNTIVFNENFYQASSVNGGGIFIGGEAALGANGLSPGAGSVRIDRNLLQGNGATSGDGGGIMVQSANGLDVAASRNNPLGWYRVNITNNMILDNVAAYAGGGISLQDAVMVSILHNTVMHNDATGTAGAAFSAGSPNQSNPQPAGIVSRAHSPALAAAFGNSFQVRPYREFSNPLLTNDIIWQNRSFYFLVDPTRPPPGYTLVPDVASGQAPVYRDLAVLGTATVQRLNAQYCDLTQVAGYSPTNFSVDPQVQAEYLNGAVNQLSAPGATTTITPPPAFDEGGNFIKVRFGPITLFDPATGLAFADGHLRLDSGARRRGQPLLFLALFADLRFDYDGQPRPVSLFTRPDVGADQVQ
jgi:large repetitive protein